MFGRTKITKSTGNYSDEIKRLKKANIMNTIFVHDAHMYIYMKFVKNVP